MNSQKNKLIGTFSILRVYWGPKDEKDWEPLNYIYDYKEPLNYIYHYKGMFYLKVSSGSF